MIFLVETLLSRNFCQKCVSETKSQQFPQCECVICTFSVKLILAVLQKVNLQFFRQTPNFRENCIHNGKWKIHFLRHFIRNQSMIKDEIPIMKCTYFR